MILFFSLLSAFLTLSGGNSANIYYTNPVLAALATHFDVTYNTVTRAASLIQMGYLCGLLFISPLGDLIPRRPLILTLVTVTASLAIGLSFAPSFAAFQALQFLTGFFNVRHPFFSLLFLIDLPDTRRYRPKSSSLSQRIWPTPLDEHHAFPLSLRDSLEEWSGDVFSPAS
jgi:MFS family permease